MNAFTLDLCAICGEECEELEAGLCPDCYEWQSYENRDEDYNVESS